MRHNEIVLYGDKPDQVITGSPVQISWNGVELQSKPKFTLLQRLILTFHLVCILSIGFYVVMKEYVIRLRSSNIKR